ncbi:MAG: Hsp70 family protein [Polyangiales bacterium]
MQPRNPSAIGLDFGTTNSALALARDGESTLATYARSDGSRSSTFRSVLFFEAPDVGPPPAAIAGPRALERYFETGGNGRLLQSLKSFLASTLFTTTVVFNRTYSLEELVAIVIGQLRREVEAQHGAISNKIVMGRPVRFVGDEGDGEEALPLRRLRKAAALAGFEDIVFEFEPVAAAHSYERTLDHDELVLVGDFGGGTSDFCLVRLGPTRRKDLSVRAKAILGTEGVGLAGDAFDGEIVQHAVSPELGAGGMYRSFMEKKEIAIPPWIYERLRRWHHVSFLKSPDTMRFLNELRSLALDKHKIEALVHLVEDDLGPQLFTAVEGTKVALSRDALHSLRFNDPPTVLDRECTRVDFERWIDGQLRAIEGCIDRLLASTNVSAKDVDRVFLTGGSALVPSVRAIFERRFGEQKLRGGDELTSVATGLSLVAEESLGS